MPWRRWAKVDEDTSEWRLYFRIGVTNEGLTTAAGVRAHLAEWLNENGERSAFFDPFMLHWVSTDFTALDKGLDLLAGQTEYVEVFGVPTIKRTSAWLTESRPSGLIGEWSKDKDFVFEVIPQKAVPTGVFCADLFARQQLRIVISGENVDTVTVLWRLPGRITAATDPESITVESQVLTGRAATRPSTVARPVGRVVK